MLHEFSQAQLPADAVELGRIQDAWGIKGWMKIHSHNAASDVLLHAKQWFLQPPTPPYDRQFKAFTGTVVLDLTETKVHTAAIVAHSAQVADRTAAESLKGARIWVSRSQFPTTDDADEFYWVDLLGLRVVNREGVELGTVHDLMSTGPSSVLCLHYEEDGKQLERLIPFVSAYVDEVNKAQKLITVDWQPDF